MKTNKGRITTVWLTQDERDALESAARASGGNVSDALRRAVRLLYMAQADDIVFVSDKAHQAPKGG